LECAGGNGKKILGGLERSAFRQAREYRVLMALRRALQARKKRSRLPAIRAQIFWEIAEQVFIG